MPKLVYLCILINFALFHWIKCLKKDEKNDKQYNKKRKLQETGYKNIDIYIDTFYLQKMTTLPFYRAQLEIYNYALIRAKKALEKLIMIREDNEGGIDLSDYKQIIQNNFSFTDFDFYNNSLDDHFSSDLIIFVTADYIFEPDSPFLDILEKCKESPKILKYKNNRPIIGYLIIDSSLFDTITNEKENEYKKEFFSYLFLHQLTHILGFNRETIKKTNTTKFQEYYSYRINPTYPIKRQKIECSNTSCNLMNFAKNYFNCPNFTLELEETGHTECQNYIHWETRIFSGEYMTLNNDFQEQVISEFTLYLLEEIGLYKVNNFTGGLMRFGKNAGCDFFTKDCNERKTQDQIINPNQTTVRNSLFSNEFCSGSTKSTCSPGRLSRGLCDNFMVEGHISDNIYKRPDKDYWAVYGNMYADYCPISISENEIDKNEPRNSYIGNCNIGKRDGFGNLIFWYSDKVNNSDDFTYSLFSDNYGENFSDTSFCAFSSVISKDDNDKFYKGIIRPTCYQMNCSSLSLTIRINEQFIVCPRGGGYVNIGGNYIGHILCPDYNLICSQTIPCNNLFDCVEKESRMKEDYIYNYTLTNVSIQIIEITPDLIFEPGYELSNINNSCPINCSQCYEKKKCFKCKHNIYKGEEENDNNPIECPYEPPKDYYYRKNETHYFRCISHCKICNNSYQCFQCDPDYLLDSNSQCIPRIEGCLQYNESILIPDSITNNNGLAYKECEICDNSKSYYCINSSREACIKIDIKNYFPNEFGCQTKCESKYDNCLSCNETECLECKTDFYLNNQKKCLLGISHCKNHSLVSEAPICIKCEGKYRCLNNDQTKCIEITDNLDSYYYLDDERDKNDCMEKCSNKYNEKCIKCTRDECLNCEENYLLYSNKDCIKKLENCKEHFFDGIKVSCLECEPNFYCINNNKSVCSYISNDELHFYYKVDNEPNPCYEKCFETIPYCIECDNKDICKLCQPIANLTEGKCILIVPPPGKCFVNITHDINDTINDINLKLYLNNYLNNYPNLINIFGIIPLLMEPCYCIIYLFWSEEQ